VLTVWVSDGDVEPLYLESPPYIAVIVCDPTAKADVVTVAWAAALTGRAEPRLVVPSRNCTVPVGVVPDHPAMVAVKVTDWPAADGFTDDVVAVVVFTFDTGTPPRLAAA
jgi:hypothetical protein